MNTQLSQRIRIAREHVHLGQEALGDAIGKNRKTIINYESGASEPTASLLLKIAQTTHVNTLWLLEGLGEMESAPPISSSHFHRIPLLNPEPNRDELLLDRALFKTSPDRLHALKVEDRSMIPTFPPESWVLCENESCFKGDGFYVIKMANRWVLKRLQAKIDGHIHIIALDESYERWSLTMKEFESVEVFGRVIRCVV